MATQNNTLAAQVAQFVKENYFLKSGGGEVFIIAKDKFERTDVADTYDRHGYKIGHEQAGDNHALNRYSEIGERYQSTVEDWQENDWHDPEESTQLWYRDYTESESKLDFENWLIDAMQLKFADEQVINTCLAYNYFDNENWRSIIIAGSDDLGIYDVTGYNEMSEEDATEIAQEFFEKEYQRDGPGTKEYMSENYIFINSYCLGAWADWYVHDRVESYA